MPRISLVVDTMYVQSLLIIQLSVLVMVVMEDLAKKTEQLEVIIQMKWVII